MNVRMNQVMQKLGKQMDKIREKLDEVNAQEMEGSREYEEFRRKTTFIRRQKRKHGLIRNIGTFLYNWAIFILSLIGWYKSVKKVVKEMKKTEELPSVQKKKFGFIFKIFRNVSPSQHTLTVVFPEVSNPTTTATNISVLPKKQQ
ncbi:Protein CBG24341 [Caenorhabditis briggsae]|uniref:Protein CBG24341 n=1 Tax=Caenorhabditis briggsae TaxID=6238 RepID=A8WKH8_CAEBR|nr:Protein CBG24341 [Caenorhabditis briggsae]CAP20973.2 Protein CBG24341 [Caenorhabditis briggsae]